MKITPSGKQILQLVYAGHSDKEIAGMLFISVSTVRYHINKMFDTFDVVSRTELVSKAIRLNMIQISVDS